MSKTFWRVALSMIGGPAAGAFGLWLMTSYPSIHQAICVPGA